MASARPTRRAAAAASPTCAAASPDLIDLAGLWISEDGTRAMRIARDLRVSVWQRRGGRAHLADAPARWYPPKDGAEASDRARDRLGYLQVETGDPGLGSTYDLMVATARVGPGKWDWVRPSSETPPSALRLFPEGAASFYEAVLGAWDDVVAAIRGGDRWMQPLSTWRPAAGEHEALDLASASRALDEARQRRGVHFEDLSDHAARVLRVTSLRTESPRPLSKLTRLEALALDVLPMTPALVDVLAALPALAALEVSSDRSHLAPRSGGFRALEVLSLPHLDGSLSTVEPFVRSLPALHTLRLPEAQLSVVPALFFELPRLAVLDLSGVPIPEADLAALRRARPALEIRISPVNLGWDAGVPGVLRVPDGFPVPDVPPAPEGWMQGFRVQIAQRQVTVVVRARQGQVDDIDFQEEIHGPVAVEDFVRRGPPVTLTPADRAQLRRQLEAGLTGTSS